MSADENFSSTIKLLNEPPQVQPYFKNAYGYAVFPRRLVGRRGTVDEQSPHRGFYSLLPQIGPHAWSIIKRGLSFKVHTFLSCCLIQYSGVMGTGLRPGLSPTI